MDTSEYRNEASVVIDRGADDLYDMVADVSRMGRWSPMCTGGAYDDDGEWFTGTNAMGDTTWETRCRVVVAERGREFTFVNHGVEGNVEMVRWGFRFTSLGDGRTEVTESWEVLPSYAEGLGSDEAGARQVLDMMGGLAREGMPETLAALKRDAESLPCPRVEPSRADGPYAELVRTQLADVDVDSHDEHDVDAA